MNIGSRCCDPISIHAPAWGATAPNFPPYPAGIWKRSSANLAERSSFKAAFYSKYRKKPCPARGANLPGFLWELGVRTNTQPSILRSWQFRLLQMKRLCPICIVQSTPDLLSKFDQEA